MLIRNVSPSGRRLGRRDGREVDDGLGAGQRVLGLAEVGQVGDHRQPELAAVVAHVDVQHVVAVLAQLAHDVPAALAAAAGDHDPHAPIHLLGGSMALRGAVTRRRRPVLRTLEEFGRDTPIKGPSTTRASRTRQHHRRSG